MTSTGKGFELSVLNSLKFHYESQGASIIYDCDFYEEGNDKTTQIDILMVLRSGVYVIECKDWQGEISDDGGRFIWHQKYIDDYGVEKERTYHSPVVQNRKHSNWISKVVPENVPVYSFVVFSEGVPGAFHNILFITARP